MTTILSCRVCAAPVTRNFCDLGESPLANAYLPATAEAIGAEPRFPLHAYVCDRCLLVQVGAFAPPEQIFGEYAYFSSFSSSWLEHARTYVESIVPRLGLGVSSLVVEVASNDGYLLQYFLERGVPVLGVEPAANVAAVATEKGVRTEARFFGVEAARELRDRYGAADLLVANNVIAHVPDLHDFIDGMRFMLADDGTATIEFPHLLRLVEGGLFDTIYHEHFSYFSLHTLERALSMHELAVVDLEELETHGGSLRLFVRHAGSAPGPSAHVEAFRAREVERRLLETRTYDAFQGVAERKRGDVRDWLAQLRAEGKRIACYGAPAKGNTLLNFCGLGVHDIPYTVDKSPYKQRHVLPGSHIPIEAPEHLRDDRPDVVWILPWNLRDEIAREIAYVREWGAQLAVAMPELRGA